MQRAVELVAKAMALLGGAVLLALVGVTCLSISGRWLSGVLQGAFDGISGPGVELARSIGPIRGDFELVEIGVAFAIMAFLPWCQLTRAHASVDIATSAMPDRVEKGLALLWEVVFALVLIVIAWRLYAGMEAKARYGETTFMLQVPVWWGYAATFAASVIAATVAVYAVWTRVADLRTPRSELVGSGDADQVHPPASGG